MRSRADRVTRRRNECGSWKAPPVGGTQADRGDPAHSKQRRSASRSRRTASIACLRVLSCARPGRWVRLTPTRPAQPIFAFVSSSRPSKYSASSPSPNRRSPFRRCCASSTLARPSVSRLRATGASRAFSASPGASSSLKEGRAWMMCARGRRRRACRGGERRLGRARAG